MRSPLQCLALAIMLLLPAIATAQEARSFTGTAHNVTVGVQAGVTLQVIGKSDGTFDLTGAFDNISLAGDVSGSGGLPRAEDGTIYCADGHECLLFSGTILLGPDAGFDAGTTSDFVLHLDINGTTGTATGVYHIGLLPGFPFEQYGLLTLSEPVT